VVRTRPIQHRGQDKEVSMVEYARYPSLVGQSAYVSGGATGLGSAFVSQLAAQGAHVAFVDTNEAAARELVAAIAERGDPEPFFQVADVRDIQALRASIDEASQRFGSITVLVNNAANDARYEVGEVDVALWDEGMAVNVRHHFFAAQAVLPGMREARRGSIINLGSISAHAGFTGMPAYITAKAGIEGLTRTLAREFGSHGIRVNCIIPGWVMTPRQLQNWVREKEKAQILSMQCLPRLLVADDVARMLLWLAADDSSGCTAQTWVVDGGWE
jgi:D-xylose 1-dehydrogenase